MLASACELFLGKSESQIRNVAQETLEGHQRAIMGNMTVEVSIRVWTLSNKSIITLKKDLTADWLSERLKL